MPHNHNRTLNEIWENQLSEAHPWQVLEPDFEGLGDSELVLTYDFKQGGTDND